MFDIGSYRNAISILDGNGSAGSRPMPKPRARDHRAPVPPSYESVTHTVHRDGGTSRSHGNHRYVDHDNDWVSVPINGERQHMRTNGYRSSELDDGRNSVPTSSGNRHRSEYKVSSRRGFESNDDLLPVRNGGYGQHTNGFSGRRVRSVEMLDADVPSSRYDGSSDRTHRTSRQVYHSSAAPRPSGRTSNITLNGSSSSDWDDHDRVSSSRMIFNGEVDSGRRDRSFGPATRAAPEEKRFLNEVQKELEFQRQNWKDEIEKMTGSMTIGDSFATMATKSSYVDTRGVEPRFKAFVDVSEFPPSSISVNVDKISNKIIVEAKQTSRIGSVAKTFTQKVQMPRFADETRLSARMNRDGILKIEVPLIYYFPEEERSRQETKSFVYGVHENDDGSKTMEIVVRPGKDISIEDLRVGMSNGKLIVYVERSGGSGGRQQQIIKKYTLPESADVDRISSKATNDGCLTICVPMY